MTGSLAKVRNTSFLAGGIALALSLLGMAASPRAFFAAYLQGYLLCLGVALGCTGIWMLHNVTGGGWGLPIQRILRAASRTLPLFALFFVPILLGLGQLYPWTNTALMHQEERLAGKLWYLNPAFFTGRAALCFAIWIAYAAVIRRRSIAHGGTPGTSAYRKLQNASASGLLVYSLTVTFAAVDWLLSLDASYYSTIFGLLLLVFQMLSGFAFATAVAIIFRGERSFAELPSEKIHDLGNFLLMSVMLWAYLHFSQYLITWSGQLPEEIAWYNRRSLGGWWTLAMALLFGSFVIPFFLLLFRKVKRSFGKLLAVSCLLLVMRWLELVWLVDPSFSPMALKVSWLDVVLPGALAALWFGAFLYCLDRLEGEVRHG